MSGFDEKLVATELEHANEEPNDPYYNDPLADVFVFMKKSNMDMLEEPRFDEDKIQLWHDGLTAQHAKRLRGALNSVIHDAQRNNSVDYVATPLQLAQICDSSLQIVWNLLSLLYSLGYDVPKEWSKIVETKWESVKDNTPSNHGAKLPEV